MSPVTSRAPVFGSYVSALWGLVKIKIRSSGSRTPTPAAPVAAKVPVAGSYNSGPIETSPESETIPPAIKTFPLVKSIAACPARGVVILPVGENVPVDCASAPGVMTRESSAETRTIFMADNSDRDFIAWTSKISQVHGNPQPRRNACKNSNIDLQPAYPRALPNHKTSANRRANQPI